MTVSYCLSHLVCKIVIKKLKKQNVSNFKGFQRLSHILCVRQVRHRRTWTGG